MTSKTVFVCQNCGGQSPKWQGKCPLCDSWNSFVEEERPSGRLVSAGAKFKAKPLLLHQVEEAAAPFPTLPELDRVLGGGIMPGSLVLLGGAPGIGKSTLLLQAASRAARVKPVLYVSGEESQHQTKLRAQRLGLASGNLHLLHEVSLELILNQLDELSPGLAVIDSIQTLYKEDLGSAPGSVAQVRECAAELLRYSKNRQTAVILVGHVTKDGSIAGPRVLEHIVDTVLYLEGENHQAYRILRAFKHRFGSTREAGIFEMTDTGMREVANPSGLFLESRADSPGSVVTPVLEGRRPLLLELQALVCRSWGGFPKRTATGADPNRMAILLAVLEKRCRMNFGQSDVYVNVTGALKVKEPSADLALAMAMASSACDVRVPADWIVFGEVGLGGEIRPVAFAEDRLREAAAIGFKQALLPQSNAGRASAPAGLKAVGVGTLQEAVTVLLNPPPENTCSS